MRTNILWKFYTVEQRLPFVAEGESFGRKKGTGFHEELLKVREIQY